MIDYERYCQIRDHLDRQGLNVAQTARVLGMDARTVARWAKVAQWRARTAAPRPSKLDAYKGQIVRWLDSYPYSAQQIWQRLRELAWKFHRPRENEDGVGRCRRVYRGGET